MDAFSIFSPLVSSQKRRVYSPQSTVAFQICPPKNHHIRLKDPPTKLLQMLSTFRTSFLSIIIGPSLLRTIEREFVLRGGVVKAAGCKAARRVIKIIRHQNTSRDQLAESLEDDWKGLRRYLPIACGAEEGGGGVPLGKRIGNSGGCNGGGRLASLYSRLAASSGKERISMKCASRRIAPSAGEHISCESGMQLCTSEYMKRARRRRPNETSQVLECESLDKSSVRYR